MDAEGSDDHGYLGPLGEVLSLYPDGRDAVSLMNSKVMTEGILDQAVRSVVAAAASIKWADPIQLEKHLGISASERGMDLEDARERLLEPDWPRIDPAERALITFATKAANEPFKMVSRDVEAAGEHGWSERETVEALTVVCVVAYMAVANLALGITQGSN